MAKLHLSIFSGLFSIFLVSCGAGVGGGGGGSAQAKRVTSSSDCKQAKADAQDIVIQWAKNRKAEGRPVSEKTAAALLDLARFESGGGKGMSFANITSHGNEANTNKAGWNGVVKANSSQVESFLNNYSASHETNFGALQISPNVLINYGTENSFKRFVNSASSPSDLYNKCLAGLAYNDGSKVMSHLSNLWAQRGAINAKFQAMKRFNSRNQSSCRNNKECNEAAEYFGRWLSYCPRLNLDNAQVVFDSKYRSRYFGALRKTGRNPGVCEDLIAAELQGYPALVESPPSQETHENPGKKLPADQRMI